MKRQKRKRQASALSRMSELCNDILHSVLKNVRHDTKTAIFGISLKKKKRDLKTALFRTFLDKTPKIKIMSLKIGVHQFFAVLDARGMSGGYAVQVGSCHPGSRFVFGSGEARFTSEGMAGHKNSNSRGSGRISFQGVCASNSFRVPRKLFSEGFECWAVAAMIAVGFKQPICDAMSRVCAP